MSQITTATLTCGQCSNEFPINISVKPTSITCPFCQENVSEDMIEQIYNAALIVADLNHDFIKYSYERSEPLFQLATQSKEVKLPVDDIE